eukprot:CAMPEP_0181352722 /NCGR_PEP_ID=MMETSP1106-20121128/2461_1 /TAXON_ID=81844 /ORGANISM="Mantoniella antarctica, Strain SL-175" /LENGTH=65 /DNA_ID=CAMNT_0023465301 /DNA_START=72 /DNA_END=269 /DNA_ORIENTATION=-
MGLFDTGLGDAAKRALGLVGDAAGAVVGFVAAHEEYLHYCMIPAIIIVGMNTSPKPSLSMLLTPM